MWLIVSYIHVSHSRKYTLSLVNSGVIARSVEKDSMIHTENAKAKGSRDVLYTVGESWRNAALY